MDKQWQLESLDSLLYIDDLNNNQLFEKWDEFSQEDEEVLNSFDHENSFLIQEMEESYTSLVPEETSLFEEEDFPTPDTQNTKKSGFFPKPMEDEKIGDDIIADRASEWTPPNSKIVNGNSKPKWSVKKIAPKSTFSKCAKKKTRKAAKKTKNYSQMVDSILGTAKRSEQVTELSVRRDVINKKILRGFKKYIAKLFAAKRVRPWRMKMSESEFKDTLVTEAQRINLLSADDVSNKGDLKELICWMAMSKNTAKAKSLFDYKNKSILLLEEVLTKYSHKKLERMYQDNNISMIYEYFINNGLGDFIKKCPKNKKRIYKKHALSIHSYFN